MQKHLMVWSVTALLLARPCLAQGPAAYDLPSFQRSAFYRGRIGRALAAIPADVFQKCPALRAAGSSTLVLQPLVFASDGYPVAGVWKQNFPIAGCHNDTTLHFYFSATPDEKVNTQIGAPGSTGAGLVLQNDVLSYARIGARLVLKDCALFQVKDTNSSASAFGIRPHPT